MLRELPAHPDCPEGPTYFQYLHEQPMLSFHCRQGRPQTLVELSREQWQLICQALVRRVELEVPTRLQRYQDSRPSGARQSGRLQLAFDSEREAELQLYCSQGTVLERRRLAVAH